ncbi:MAG: endonuclease/exonuclease/phosphatase family protein [Candidatus Hydrogenedentes bacterium]|nr:endonuclease/exonuclease/phosphatase family protein [Candidatus Hydrogenedentota bacterium]
MSLTASTPLIRILTGLFDALLAIASIALVLFSIGLLGARYHWTIDLATSFEPLYLIASAGILISVILRRKPILIGLVLLVTIFHATLILPYYFPPATKHLSGPVLRIMSVNLQWDTSRPRNVFNALRTVKPDVIAFQEVTPERLIELQNLLEEYPHRIHSVDSGVLGVALFSRYPLNDLDQSWMTKGVYPTLMAEIEAGGPPLSVMITHTIPPFSKDWAMERNKQLAECAARLNAIEGPCVLVGDLNVTMWSPYFRDLIKSANLKNAREGFGIVPTYSSGRKRLIPIDHFLFRGDVQVTGCAVGPHTGSDHRPLVVDFIQTFPHNPE